MLKKLFWVLLLFFKINSFCFASNTTPKDTFDNSIWFKSAMRGVVSGIMLQPFDLVKTNSQACLKNSQPIHIYKNIIKNDGYLGLFKGVGPSISRSVVRDMFRFPMIVKLPDFYSNTLGVSQSSILQPLTGVSIAMFESFALGPLERAKVFAMTKGQGNKTRIGLVEMFKGMKYQVIASSVGWSSFLLSQHIYKSLFQKFKKTDNEQVDKVELNAFDLSLIGSMAGFTTATCFMPFDACKTLVQKANPEKDTGLFSLLAKIIKSKGIKGLYSGWQMTFSSLIINSMINTNFLNWLQNGGSVNK